MQSNKIEYQQHHYLTEKRGVTSGKRLIIIGEAADGPLHEPTLVYSNKMAKTIFSGGALVDRFNDILSQGESINVYLMRIQKGEFIFALELIKNLDFDLLLMDSLEFKVENLSEIEKYIEVAINKSNTGRLIHAFFQLRSFTDINELHQEFQYIEELTQQVGLEKYELGKYFSVVVNQFAGHNASAIYAGLVTRLGLTESPINKPLDVELKQAFTKDEIRTLSSNGIVCFRKSFHHNVVCASCTCAVVTAGSVHKNIANYRIVQTIANELSEDLDVLIGSVFYEKVTTKASEFIKVFLNDYVKIDVLTDFNYEVQADYPSGYMSIKLELVPLFTTEKIVTHSQVKILK